MSQDQLTEIIAGIRSGDVVPYLGPGTLAGVVNKETEEPIPADSDSLILAMNGGKPMAPKLMYEFPRAAMNLELKKGRSFVNRFLEETYGKRPWSPSSFHRLISDASLPYVIDVNRDTQLQDFYANRPHVLVVGIARIGGTDYRFKVYRYDGLDYAEVDQTEISSDDPVLFKPMGSPTPEPTFIASDADFVDYITELMGGFAVPDFVKDRRIGKKYVTLGLRFTRDTERMVFSDMIFAAGDPAGWALIAEPTDKERRFCADKNIHVVEESLESFAHALANEATVTL